MVVVGGGHARGVCGWVGSRKGGSTGGNEAGIDGHINGVCQKWGCDPVGDRKVVFFKQGRKELHLQFTEIPI